jgi:hypothetical protein
MAEVPVDKSAPPEPFVNTATQPRWLGTFGMVAISGLGLLLAWVSSLNPIFGLPMNHPASLTFMGLMVLVGIGGVVHVWSLSDEEWRKVPDGPLSPEFRKLADAGRKRDAIRRLQEETGAGLSEAHQVVGLYLAGRAGRG